jgi:type I restriction enzyme S subunit
MGSAGQNGFHDTALAKGPGIVIGRSGASFGQVHFSKEDFWPHNTGLYVTDFKGNDPLFAFYFLKALDFDRFNSGSAQPSLNRNFIYPIPIRVPKPAEQRAIARILGTLDDKIELNRRMNATLEAMARALFQSWFVDFDPVHAKAAGRQPPGMDEKTAAFFPSSFQDSELGEIPEGWNVGKISDLTEFSRSSVNPGNFPDETFDHYSLPAFDEGRQPKAEVGAEIKSNKLTVTPDAVLLSKLNPHIPRIWLPKLSESRRSVCSTEFLVACPSSQSSQEYLFALFTSIRFSTVYSTLVTGTTGSHQRIKADAVQNLETVIPPEKLVTAFTAFTRPLFARINHNTAESRTLATLRDTLLPKLLSGELPAAPATEEAIP